MARRKKNEEEIRLNAAQLAGMLDNAYAQCDDDRMEEAILKLSQCKEERPMAAAVLYQAIEFRPWDGKYYEPKSWRSDVTKAINTLYESEELLKKLKAHESELAEVMYKELNEIFEEPLFVMNPVLELKITTDKYTSLFTGLLELLVDIANMISAGEDISLDERLSGIEKLDEKMVHLAEELKEDRKYGHYTGALRNAEKIRDALNTA